HAANDAAVGHALPAQGVSVQRVAEVAVLFLKLFRSDDQTHSRAANRLSSSRANVRTVCAGMVILLRPPPPGAAIRVHRLSPRRAEGANGDKEPRRPAPPLQARRERLKWRGRARRAP